MNIRILLVGGYLQSGKDLAADYICKKYGFERFAFADCLKDEVSEFFGINRQSLDTGSLYDNGETVRDLLIRYGDEKRKDDQAYWIKKVIRKIEGKRSDQVVIPDFRYPEEYHFCKEHFSSGLISTMKFYRYDYPKRTDPSETSLENFPFDYYINNQKDIYNFYTDTNSFPLCNYQPSKNTWEKT